MVLELIILLFLHDITCIQTRSGRYPKWRV